MGLRRTPTVSPRVSRSWWPATSSTRWETAFRPTTCRRPTEIVRQLRPLAEEAVDAELAEAMGRRQVETKLRDRLDRMLGEFRRSQTEASERCGVGARLPSRRPGPTAGVASHIDILVASGTNPIKVGPGSDDRHLSFLRMSLAGAV
jgi:hypothetical protein